LLSFPLRYSPAPPGPAPNRRKSKPPFNDRISDGTSICRRFVGGLSPSDFLLRPPLQITVDIQMKHRILSSQQSQLQIYQFPLVQNLAGDIPASASMEFPTGPLAVIRSFVSGFRWENPYGIATEVHPWHFSIKFCFWISERPLARHSPPMTVLNWL